MIGRILDSNLFFEGREGLPCGLRNVKRPWIVSRLTGPLTVFLFECSETQLSNLQICDSHHERPVRSRTDRLVSFFLPSCSWPFVQPLSRSYYYLPNAPLRSPATFSTQASQPSLSSSPLAHPKAPIQNRALQLKILARCAIMKNRDET